MRQISKRRWLAMLLACLVMISCLATGCTDKQKPEDMVSPTEEPAPTGGTDDGSKAQPGTEGTKNELKKIADHLYETTFDGDFDWKQTVTPSGDGKAGCSGVQNGQFRGRNYDWSYADTDLCVIHAAKT